MPDLRTLWHDARRQLLELWSYLTHAQSGRIFWSEACWLLLALITSFAIELAASLSRQPIDLGSIGTGSMAVIIVSALAIALVLSLRATGQQVEPLSNFVRSALHFVVVYNLVAAVALLRIGDSEDGIARLSDLLDWVPGEVAGKFYVFAVVALLIIFAWRRFVQHARMVKPNYRYAELWTYWLLYPALNMVLLSWFGG